MIVLLHAYSRGNSGDGLLVDLALGLIREAVGDGADIRIVAMDPSSFADLAGVVAAPVSGEGRGIVARSVAAAVQSVQAALVPGPVRNGLGQLLATADLIVGVGGGYMRAGTLQEGLKACLAHGIQSYCAARSQRPSVYLSQSVGPFRGPLGAVLKNTLRGIDRIYLRDDRSLAALGGPAARRAPDLALIELASSASSVQEQASFSRGYLIARDLDKPGPIRRRYLQSLADLRALIPQLEPVVQSSTRGNDDLGFYQGLGWGGAFRSVKQALSESGPGVVVSVRLHGALQALISGCPAIHLSYERKGFGAYSDLGIGEFVHQATDFDPKLVADQYSTLSGNAGPFWQTVAAATPRIRAAREEIVRELRQAYARGRGIQCAA